MLRTLGVLAALLAAGAGPLAEDTPVASQPVTGAIHGKIASPVKIEALTAVSRITGQTYRPSQFDPVRGTFAFANLDGDASYDIVVTLPAGRHVEGIDLDFVDSRLIRLAELRRHELGLPSEPARPFTRADAKAIINFIAEMKDFSDTRRVLYLSGRGRRATALVELLRTRDFHARGGDEVIWRVELWYFEHAAGSWQHLADQDRVLRRERLSLDQWRAVSVEYYPALSAYVSPDGTSEPLEFTIPEAPDPSRGRPAGGDVELQTAPHILGIDAPPAATRPVN